MRFVPCSLWWGPWVHSLAVFFFLGPRVVPSLAVWCWQSSDKQNRKRLLCLFPVWNNERQWRGNRQSCTRPSALVFFFGSVSQNWSRTGPNCKEGSYKPKLDMQNSQSLLLFFFPNKERLEFLGQASRRREQNWQTSRTTNGEARKYLLGKWQKRLQSASGYLNNPYKNSQTAPTTTHGRSNQQASAEMTPLRPQGVPNHCSCSDSWADTPWAKGHGESSKNFGAFDLQWIDKFSSKLPCRVLKSSSRNFSKLLFPLLPCQGPWTGWPIPPFPSFLPSGLL